MIIRNSKAFSAILPLGAGLILILSFLLGFHWRDEVYQVMCSGAEDEHCTREWLTTFGTLAAALIAAPALAMGLGQIRNASRHHNELLQLQMRPKLALAQRIAELVDRISTANRNLRAALDHDFDERLNEPQAKEAAYRSGLKAYERIRQLIRSSDFDDFEKEIGSGKPHVLSDVRGQMENTHQPAGFAPEGSARDFFIGRRVIVMNSAEAANNYANACLREAEHYMSLYISRFQ